MIKIICALLVLFLLPGVVKAHGVVNIKMTSQGFEPAQVTVDSNSEVVFINEDTNPRWPASDIHPTHLIYPQFDPKKEIKPQESWTFKPSKIGTFKFHDHLFPEKKGTLTVTGKEEKQQENSFINFLKDWWNNLPISKFFAPKKFDLNPEVKKVLSEGKLRLRNQGENLDLYLRSQMDVCFKQYGRDDCYKELSYLFFHQFDLSLILSLLQDNEKYPEVFSRCHQLTHYLTRLAYQKEGDILKVYDQCTSVCHGGCYHGAIEQYLSDRKLIEGGIDYLKVGQEIPRVCGKREVFKVPLLYDECLHGIGHGTMYVTDGDLIFSLKMCDVLSSQKDRETCYSGAFMENSSSSTNLDHPSKFVKKEDPMFPCNILEEKYLPLCFRYQSSHFAIISQSNWQEVARLCSMVPEPYQKACFLTIGSNLVGFTRDLNLIVKNCSEMPESHKIDCYQGAVDALAIRYRGDTSWGENFCSLAEEEFQEPCFKQYGSSLSNWSDKLEDKNASCNRITNTQFATWCRG